MDKMEVKNAVIKSAIITNDDHGLLSAWLALDYGSAVQSFGGYSLYSPGRPNDKGNYCGLFIWRVMEVVGVSKWDQLPGKTIRVRAGWTNIEAIGHIIENKWFEPAKEFKEYAKIVGDDTDD